MSGPRTASHTAYSSASSASSSSLSSDTSPMSSPSSASSYEQDASATDAAADDGLKQAQAQQSAAPAAAAPLVSILRNPKSSSEAVPAGKLTRPTLAIPEVDEAPEGVAGTIASISPSATFSSIKSAFAGIGRRKSSNHLEKPSAKAVSQPLGQSFKREGPPPVDEKGRIQGAPLLDIDPRAEDAENESAVDLSSSYSSQASSLSAVTSSSSSSGPVESAQSGPSQSSASISSASSSSSVGRRGRLQSASDSSDSRRGRQHHSLVRSASTASASSGRSGSEQSSSSHAIRFCPLPTTGRLKRANSITIGIAARSQMLLSQGSGPVPRGQQYQIVWQDGVVSQQQHPSAAAVRAAGGGANGRPHHAPYAGVHPSDPRHAGFPNQRAAAWFEAGGELPPDVIDVGAELKKVGKLAWRKMRGDGKKSAADAGTAAADASTAATAAAGAGEGPANGAGGAATVAAPKAPATPKKLNHGPPSPPPPPASDDARADTSIAATDLGWTRSASNSSLPPIHDHEDAEAEAEAEVEADGMKTPRAPPGGGSASGLVANGSGARSVRSSFIVPLTAAAEKGGEERWFDASPTSGDGGANAAADADDGEDRPATPTGPEQRRISTGALFGGHETVGSS